MSEIKMYTMLPSSSSSSFIFTALILISFIILTTISSSYSTVLVFADEEADHPSSTQPTRGDSPENPIQLRGVRRTPHKYNEVWTDSDSETIFVGVAAFRDVECVITIGHMYSRASNPRRIVLGIIEQNEHGDPSCVPDSFRECNSPDFCPVDNIRMRRVASKQARGPTYGRYVSMLMYRGENYYMMIDSHNVFVRNWDRKSIMQLHRARTSRPVISHYPNIWSKSGEEHESNGNVMVMCNGHYLDLGFIRMDAAWMDRRIEPYYQPFSAGGYLFSDGRLVHDVPFDPYLDYLFDGEEILYSVRMWTNGYDLFTPGESVLFHDYNRHTAKRYWHVPGSQWGYQIVWAQRRAQHFLRARIKNSTELLVGQYVRDPKIIRGQEKYGVGKRRSLEQYERYAKIDPVHRIANFAFCQQHVKPKYDL